VFFIFTVLLIFYASVLPYSIHCRAFFRPPPHRASNTPFSVQGLLARDRFYFPVFLLFLLVISPISISLLWGVMLGPNL
jgi:hypothetical protein